MPFGKAVASPPASPVVRRGARVFVLLAWPTLVATVLSLSPWTRQHWAVDLTTHMRAHLIFGAAILCPLLYGSAHRHAATLCLLAAAANAWVVQPWTFLVPPAPVAAGAAEADAPRLLRVLYWNVHLTNSDAASVLRLVAEHDADVVVLLELNARLAAGLDPLRTTHPHHREVLGTGDAFGLAVYSRIEGTITRGRLGNAVPYLSLQTSSAAGRSAQIVGVHLYPPVGDAMWRGRNAQLSDLAHQLNRDTTLPRIVGGDFNITPWAEGYQRFLAMAGLVDTRPGFGYMATWPRGLGPAGIPIDQVAVDAEIRIVDRRVVFASPHSDHAAVLLVAAVPGSKDQPGVVGE